MAYHTYKRAPPLSDLVETFWLYEGFPPTHRKERKLPDGSMGVVINLREDRFRIYDRRDHDRSETFRGCLLSGAQSEFIVIDTANQASVMGIHFKAGGGFPFFGMPASELHDVQVPLDALWGTTAGQLRDQLLEAKTPQARFVILEEHLLARATRPLVPHPAVSFALKEIRSAPQHRTISDLTEQIGLSPRRFIQLFSEEVGLTPKLFCRVRRFQQVLKSLQNGELSARQIEWADIASSCGYFDQLISFETSGRSRASTRLPGSCSGASISIMFPSRIEVNFLQYGSVCFCQDDAANVGQARARIRRSKQEHRIPTEERDDDRQSEPNSRRLPRDNAPIDR
jgi:AraC-like DNA-binding protein